MASNISLRIHRVICQDETGHTNWGADEIGLSGAWGDSLDMSGIIEPHKISNDMDSDEKVNYDPPITILLRPFDSKINIAVNFFLYEEDPGGGARHAAIRMREEIDADLISIGLLKENLPAGERNSDEGSEASFGIAAVAAAVGVMIVIYDKVKSEADSNPDEIFVPKQIYANIPSPSFSFNGSMSSPIRQLKFTDDNSEYIVEYDWLLS